MKSQKVVYKRLDYSIFLLHAFIPIFCVSCHTTTQQLTHNNRTTVTQLCDGHHTRWTDDNRNNMYTYRLGSSTLFLEPALDKKQREGLCWENNTRALYRKRGGGAQWCCFIALGNALRLTSHFPPTYRRGSANLASLTRWAEAPMVSMARKFLTVTKATAVVSEV